MKFVDFGELSQKYYFVLLLSFFGLLMGWIQGVYLQPNITINTSNERVNRFIKNIKQIEGLLTKTVLILCLIGFVGVILTYATVFSQISLNKYFTAQGMVKSEIKRSVIGAYLSSGMYIALPIGAILHWILGRSRIFIMLPFLLCVLFSLSFWGRVPIVMALIMLVSSKLLISLLLSKTIRKHDLTQILKQIIVVFLVGVIMLAFLGWTIEWRLSSFNETYNPLGKQNIEGNLVATSFSEFGFLFGSFRAVQVTYAYLTASVPTLNYWVSMDSEYGLGQASFPYFARLFHSLGIINEPKVIGDRALGGLLQLPSYIGYAYMDFGLIGVFLYSFILSLTSSFLFYYFMHSPKIIYLMYLSMIYSLVVLSPQISATTWTQFPIIIIGMWIVNQYLKMKSKMI